MADILDCLRSPLPGYYTGSVPVPQAFHVDMGRVDKQRIDAAAEILRLRTELRVANEAIESWRAQGPNALPATGLSLVDRLRGIYAVPINDGAGPLNGSDVFVRRFAAVPIQVRAAEEILRLREIIGTTADNVLLPDAEHLFCPKCGEECRVEINIAYCDNCTNPDDGTAEGCSPLPLFPESCYSTREAFQKAGGP